MRECFRANGRLRAMSTRKADGRNMTDEDVAAADAHWVQRCATASAKLLARLVKYHEKPPVPAGEREGRS
jgi:hypothetical protein